MGKSSKKRKHQEVETINPDLPDLHAENRLQDVQLQTAVPPPSEQQVELPTTKAAEPQPAAKKKGKSAPVLPWMKVPITIDPADGTLLEDVGGLDVRLKTALEEHHIEVLFPVQTVVWRETSGGCSTLHDICIAAPTGSGKTLAYTLPILQGLATNTTTNVSHTRALVLLPTRDLAMQVYTVLSGLSCAVGLKVAAACGHISIAEEALNILGSTCVNSSNSKNTGSTLALKRYIPAADVLVATPGRLMAHLNGTPNFSLQHIQYLVIDETDRLLRQSYQGWLPTVMAALQSQHNSVDDTSMYSNLSAHQNQNQSGRRVVKFVVSATLTRNPAKIDTLGLTYPRYIAMSSEDHRYKLPRGLAESKLVVPAEKKPFALAALLCGAVDEPTIVFTSSLEATHRLYLMLRAIPSIGNKVGEYSSSVSQAVRKSVLESFRTGNTTILVSSDAMTRGMDLENVVRVINYDAPVYVKTYVHRAGRAARANKQGSVLTLLRKEDVKHFKDMLRKVDNTYVKDYHQDLNDSGGGDDDEGGNQDTTLNNNKNNKSLPLWDDEKVKQQVDAALEIMAEELDKERDAAGGSGRGGLKTVGMPLFGGSDAAGADKKKEKKKVNYKKKKVQGLPQFG